MPRYSVPVDALFSLLVPMSCMNMEKIQLFDFEFEFEFLLNVLQ